MDTDAGSGNSSHSNSAYGSVIRGNYFANIQALFESNALTLLHTYFGSGAGVVSKYGLIFQDSTTLTILGGGAEGVAEAAVLVQGTTAKVGSTYDFAVSIKNVHFEFNNCDQSNEGDIVLGLNGETTVWGVTVDGCRFEGDGTTFTPLNIIKGDGITYSNNRRHASYVNFQPQKPANMTRFTYEGNWAGVTPTPNYIQGSANLTFTKREQANAGVNSVGGGHQNTGGTVTLADNQSITVQIYYGTLIQVQDVSVGNGALFFAAFQSSTITELSDPANLWSVTDTDTNPGWAIFKNTNSNTVTIKNYNNVSKEIIVTLLGACEGATAPT
jgi:hypothetical protein